MADSGDVVRLAGEFAIADMTLRIPHPYTLDDARAWLGGLPEAQRADTNVNMAITLATTGELMGSVGLVIERKHARAEIGFWIGVPYWSKGYMTEAAAAMLVFGFERLDLARISSYHFARNPASGRVLQKIGMRHEGVLRQHMRKWDHFEDCVMYGMLRGEAGAARVASGA